MAKLCVFVTICLLLICNKQVNGQTPTARNLENQQVFTRLYGYIRYFHPSDEAAMVNWDKLAIYGSRQVQACKTDQELMDSLKALFLPVAPTLQLAVGGNKPIFNKAALIPQQLENYQTIGWQHLGVGTVVNNNNGEAIYKSARTKKVGNVSSFTSLKNELSADSFQNRPFIFKAKLKWRGGSGHSRLWVRVNRQNKEVGFFNNMADTHVTDTSWQSYQIRGVIDTDGAFIHFGLMLVDAGEVWIKDMRLEIQKQNGDWKQVYANDFATDTIGLPPSSVTYAKNQAQLYDFTVQSNNGTDRWVSVKTKYKEQLLFPQQASVGEYIDKQIGSNITVLMPLALYGTDRGTYPAGDKQKLELLIQRLALIPSSDMNGNNLYARLGGITIAWNLFQHFYPYFSVANTHWQEDLSVALKEAYAAGNAASFLEVLQRLTAKLKDGHVSVNWLVNQAIYSPPISWEWIEGKLVITELRDTTLPLAKGDIVTQIDGKSSIDFFNEITPRISAATTGWLNYRAQIASLLGSTNSKLHLSIQKADRSIKEVALNRTENYYMPRKRMGPRTDTIQALQDGIMYINLDQASMEQIEQAMPQIQKSKAIICDLRGYPRNTSSFLTYLLRTKDTSGKWMRIPHIIYPDQEKIAGYTEMGWSMIPAKTHLKQPVFFITDGRAISYAESYMSFVEHYRLATIVGQPTAGTNGNVNILMLPGGYNISWTGMLVLKHDGSQHHGVGIRPDVYVEKTINGVRENRDEFLEKAIALAREKVK